ncbi:outer membrane lipoprotein-sorting protein [Prolixibacter denitrificans]|uniref:Outer membrane lipoprotein-sorting protein n=1 Tax=Prolixibacter denitrificans TaxID=1541063 RepID=A0A2P8CD46_9BACT|nr:outer membrane lipoprotein-sorting protein [Prolixibacter denitrificans]PSK82852.1 outer membrane lipoprotein-sorting protein [Prolixibacter denitrificans]GET21333.1 outer membrane lipoprotein-sorting protein [Prolixibacter denitrificans]
MKTKKVIVFLLVMAFGSLTAQAQDAQEIVKKANDLLRGQSNESVMTMKIIRPKWERTLKFKGWSKGNEYSLIYVLEPAKEKGQVFLKRDKEIWNWVPSIERMIKIPPSMMMQSWMGSDLTNDDLVKESSIVEDYNQKIIGEEKINGYDCYKIELTPKEDAAVVWGKIITWISKEHYYTLKNEYYDEDGYLVNVETLSKIKKMGDRTLPTYYEIVPVDKKGHKTTMEFNEVKFNIPIKDSFFSIQNMKRVH